MKPPTKFELMRAGRVRGHRIAIRGANQLIPWSRLADRSHDEMSRAEIDRLELSARTANCLKAEKIFRVSQLMALTRKELCDLPNIGKRTVDEIEVALGAFGLFLSRG